MAGKDTAAQTTIGVLAGAVAGAAGAAPDLASQLDAARSEGFKAGQSAEQSRFVAILNATGKRPEIAASEFQAGHSPLEASQAYTAMLEAELKAGGVGEGVAAVNMPKPGTAAAFGAVTDEQLEADWNANKDNCQAAAGGSKANWIAYRKWQVKQEGK